MAAGSGKVILLGEHGVVHGRPALAAALSAGCRASAEPADATGLVIEADTDAPCFGAADSPAAKSSRSQAGPVVVLADSPPYPDELRETLRRAFCAVLEGYPEKRPGLQIRVKRGLPPGAGLGCSAALAVSVVRALDGALGMQRDARQVAEESMRWERVFHGNPSGIDSAIASSGGMALFRRGKPPQSVNSPIQPLLVIGHSGQSASTRAMVEKVARLHAEERKKVEAIFDEMAELVLCGSAALGAGDALALAELMDRNQVLLQQLGVSTPRLDEMCRQALGAGAAGAKLTGSGGGGCMIALVEGQLSAEKVQRALERMGCGAFVASVGHPGGDTDSGQ
jgi:mevalonate kinase